MKSIAKRIVSLMLVMVMVIGMLPVTAFAGEAKDVGTAKYKVEIVSFIRGEVNDLRCSELLEARIYKSTDGGVTWAVATDVEGTPVSKLTYTWTNSSDSNTLMAVFLTHDLNHAYFDGDTEGGAFRGGISSTAVGAQWAAFKTPGVTMGGGFGGSFGGWWPSWGGGGNQGGNTPTTFSGTATVSVRLPNGTVITDSCSNFGAPDLAADLNNIALGIFVGDTTTLLSLLAESAIVHITCTSCYVSDVVFSERKLESGVSGTDTQVIQYTSNGQGGYRITGKDAGEAMLSMSVSKKNCTAHNGQEAGVSTKIFVFKKPTTSTTTTTLTLAKESLDSRCEYYINGVEGTTQGDGSIIFTGLTPDTEYTVDVVATYVKEDGGSSVTRYAYSFVRDTTKPVYTATVNTYLDGVKMDIEDIHGEDVTLYIKSATSEYIPLTHTGTGVYSAGVLNGTYYVHHYESTGYHQVNNDQLIISNTSGSMDIHHYSVRYDTNEGAFKTGENPGVENYASGNAVTATKNIPVRDDYVFTGWLYGGKTYAAGSTVSTSIAAPITLTAQWTRAVDVYVNVTINHLDGVNCDPSDSKDDITLDLVYAPDASTPYLETGDSITITNASHEKHSYTYSPNDETDSAKITETVYTANGATFTGLNMDLLYTVAASKSEYNVTSLTARKLTTDEGNMKVGDWVIDVALEFDPTSSDLVFEVNMDSAVPEALYPAAAIVKVLYYDTASSTWKVITQHDNGNPGVRVNITKQTGNVGSYPVWVTKSGTSDPYGYRIMVSAFVYKDGTIVPTEVATANQVYTDQNYTATIGEVNSDRAFGSLDGAYFDNGTQKGTLSAEITAKSYSVTFDAAGGTVNGHASETVSGTYYIPAFSGYQPTMDGHTFLGWWYKDSNGNYTQQATDGTLLTKDITLYAKWNQILTGTLNVAGTYVLDGETIAVPASSRATEALVVLQEISSDAVHNVTSQTVTITWSGDSGTAAYEFANLDPAKQYRIDVKLVNYTTVYQNSTTATGTYNANDYSAVFSTNPWETFVNGKLTFTPESYYQPLTVDATQIGSTYRPDFVLTQIWYTERNTTNPYQVISQHTEGSKGIKVAIGDDGKTVGNFGEYVWKENYNGNLYDYQAYVADDDVGEANALPISIRYGATSDFDTVNGTAKNTLTATLIPNKYHIIYDLNTDATDDVYTDAEAHTWSYDTAITYVPTREGYAFLGWFIDSDADAVKDDTESYVTKINADVHANVTLTAQWEELTDIYVDVIIEHGAEGGDGHNGSADKTKHNVSFTVEYRPTGSSEEYETLGDKVITWNGWSTFNVDGYTAEIKTIGSSSEKTKYTATKATFADVSADMEYTVIANKSGYTVKDVTSRTDANGTHLTLTLIYDPDNFDFAYTVKLDNTAKTMPEAIKPAAVNVKVTSWYDSPYVSGNTIAWYTITQQQNIHQRIALDSNGVGNGSYPVWMSVDGATPYYYRIEVISYELKDGTIIPVDDLAANQPTMTATYAAAGGVYSAVVNADSSCVDPDSTDSNTLTGAYYNGAQVGAIEAVVSINPHTVTLLSNGGSFSDNSTQKTLEKLVRMPDITSYTPTRAGYSFTGWAWTETSTSNPASTLSTGELLSKNLTLTAQWTPVYYKVAYELNGGTAPSGVSYADESVQSGSTVHAKQSPERAGYLFKGWACSNGETYAANAQIVVDRNLLLTAQWEKVTDIYVDVVIEHRSNNTADRHNVTFALTQRPAGSSDDYTDMPNGTKEIIWDGSASISGYNASTSSEKTEYTASTATFVNVPAAMEYTVTANKSGYTVKDVTSTTDTNGIHLTLTLIYNPDNFNFTYTVMLDDAAKDPSLTDIRPAAVNVKVTSWYDSPYVSGNTAAWYGITQQRNTHQRIALDGTGVGNGSYPVWKTLSGSTTPYYYRIEVVSYELQDGTVVPVSNLLANQPSITATYATDCGTYKAVVNADNACVDPNGTDSNPLTGAYYNSAQVGAIEAVVSINPHTVTLDPEGGKFSDDSTTDKVLVNLVQMPEITSYTPTRAGYSFTGWSWTETGTTNPTQELSTGEVLSKDLTLTAQWEKLTNLSYTVQYLEEGTDYHLLPEKVFGNKTFEDEVSSITQVIDIEGYVFVSATPETLIIGAESEYNVVKLYYLVDSDDNDIPDKYQKKITFKVVNGTWSDLTNADIVRYVTLMTAGQWAVNGTATLTDIPTGMKANSGYGNGAWDTVPPTTVSGTDEEVYTYTFKVKAPGGTPYFPPASSFDPVLSPDTGDSYHPALWIGMMCLSAVAIGGCVTVLNRRKNER